MQQFMVLDRVPDGCGVRAWHALQQERVPGPLSWDMKAAVDCSSGGNGPRGQDTALDASLFSWKQL